MHRGVRRALAHSVRRVNSVDRSRTRGLVFQVLISSRGCWSVELSRRCDPTAADHGNRVPRTPGDSVMDYSKKGTSGGVRAGPESGTALRRILESRVICSLCLPRFLRVARSSLFFPSAKNPKYHLRGQKIPRVLLPFFFLTNVKPLSVFLFLSAKWRISPTHTCTTRPHVAVT